MWNSSTAKSEGFAIEVAESKGNGSITVGHFRETFLMDMSFWGVEEYVRSWARALIQLEASTDSASCLISSMVDQRAENFIMCWPLHRFGETVLVQNSIIFLDELDSPFDPRMPWKSILPYSAVDEDGNRISEWETSMSNIREFRVKMPGATR